MILHDQRGEAVLFQKDAEPVSLLFRKRVQVEGDTAKKLALFRTQGRPAGENCHGSSATIFESCARHAVAPQINEDIREARLPTMPRRDKRN